MKLESLIAIGLVLVLCIEGTHAGKAGKTKVAVAG
jgi:hypothetical protein